MSHMQQLSYTPFPPHRILSPAKPISAADALVSIQSYLERAQDTPCLHPDATFSPKEGPIFARHASEGGLVLQLLRRVERGLDGERIAAELPGKGTGLDDNEQLANNGDGIAGHNYMEQMEEQGVGGITEGEIGQRNNFVKDLTIVEEPSSTERKRKVDQVEDGGKLSKEDRKRAKKERQLAEKQQKYRDNERKNEAAQTNDISEDVDMIEEPVLSPGEDDQEVIDKQKSLDTAVQNAPPAQDDRQSKDEERRRRKVEKKARRSAKAEAHERAAHELHGSEDEQKSKPPVVDDYAGERGKVQVVDRFGRDAEAPDGSEDKKKKKKKKDKNN